MPQLRKKEFYERGRTYCINLDKLGKLKFECIKGMVVLQHGSPTQIAEAV
jgi:hypothetical protein